MENKKTYEGKNSNNIQKPKSARGRKKTPQEIREEMLKKLNETK